MPDHPFPINGLNDAVRTALNKMLERLPELAGALNEFISEVEDRVEWNIKDGWTMRLSLVVTAPAGDQERPQ
jgi:hypothetical protein